MKRAFTILANRQRKVLLVNVPPQAERQITEFFLAKPTRKDGVWLVPERFAVALSRYYTALCVDDSFHEWEVDWYSYESVMSRIPIQLKNYNGGYEADIVAHTLSTRHHGILADMGGGKTIMVLECVAQASPGLVFVPPAVWFNAYANKTKAADGGPMGDLTRYYKWMRYSSIMGSANKNARTASLRVGRDLWAVSPYLAGGVVDQLMELPVGTLGVDESDLMRDPECELAKAAFTLRDRAPFRTILSGYPDPTDIGDLWAQISFLAPGRLGTEREYIERFASSKSRRIRDCKFDDAEKNKEALTEISAANLVTSLRIEEVWPQAEHLPCIPRVVNVTLTPVERAAYNEMEATLELRHGAEVIRKPHSGARDIVLREICSGFVYRDRKSKGRSGARAIRLTQNPAKLQATRKLMNLSPERGGFRGMQVVIWYQFDEEVSYLTEYMEDARISHGLFVGNSRSALQALNAFTSEKIRVLLTHEKSASHGIRLHHSWGMLWYTLSWSSRGFEQGKRRIWRPGQKRVPSIKMLVCRDTREQDVLRSLQEHGRRKNTTEEILQQNRIPLSFPRRIGATA